MILEGAQEKLNQRSSTGYNFKYQCLQKSHNMGSKSTDFGVKWPPETDLSPNDNAACTRSSTE